MMKNYEKQSKKFPKSKKIYEMCKKLVEQTHLQYEYGCPEIEHSVRMLEEDLLTNFKISKNLPINQDQAPFQILGKIKNRRVIQ
jgi:hypothetical protein